MHLLLRSLVVPAFLVAVPSFAQNTAPLASVPLDVASKEHIAAVLGLAKLEAPRVATAVAAIVKRADTFDQKRRGRFFPMGPMLRQAARGATGHPALLLLEPVIFPERFVRPQSPSAQVALRAGLLEAAGNFKDDLAAPVYRAILANGVEFFELRAAAEALGKLGLDADVTWLAKLATSPGNKQDAVIAGLGSCRHPVAARALMAVAASKPDTARAKRVAQSLGTMGSAWALETLDKPAAEMASLRSQTARAALTLFISTEGEARDAASDALMAIDAPETPALIAAEMAHASPPGQTALAALRTRFDHNPTRVAR
ncbi:MAG: hypothetical protein K1X64_10870 [Myxococcaceae bacterium]|nr:hypothetical protein [Myxococcaceae bacterium]